jgi:hypothetical protein
MLARRRDPALVNAGALDDPIIRGIDFAGEILVREDVIG